MILLLSVATLFLELVGRGHRFGLDKQMMSEIQRKNYFFKKFWVIQIFFEIVDKIFPQATFVSRERMLKVKRGKEKRVC